MIRSLRALLVATLVLFATNGQAQTFVFNTSTAIPDTVVDLCLPIAVQGLPVQATSDTFGLASVCINITHTYVSDLEIVLKTPQGQVIPLLSRIGGAGRNFVGTCLAEDGTAQIGNGAAPFTGVFRPDGDLNDANRGLNPNGVWRLCISDRAAQDFGILNSFSLTFSRNPPASPPPPPTPCSFSNMLACACPDGSDTCDLLPDMKASSSIMATSRTEYVGRLTISNSTPNIGYGPLEIHGTGECFCDTVPVACGTPCPNGIKEKVIQTIYHKMRDTFTTYTRPAGYMAYHPSHGHVHMEEWSQFTLRTRSADPNPLHWPIVATGRKVSFCLVNLADCRTANGLCVDDSNHVLDLDSMPNAALGTVTGCGRDQGIWPGKADIYDQSLDGQDILLDDVCNGSYYLVSYTDPNNNIKEMNDSNNVAIAPITLTRQAPPAAPPLNITFATAYQIAAGATIPPGVRFTWDFGDGTTDTANNPALHEYATPGNYTIRLTIHYKCGDRFSQSTAIVTSAKKLLTAAELGLSVEPNPAQGGRFLLRYRKPTPAPASLTLLDITGRVLRTLPVETAVGRHSLPVEAAGLPAGAYLIRLATESGMAIVRVMLHD